MEEKKDLPKAVEETQNTEAAPPEQEKEEELKSLETIADETAEKANNVARNNSRSIFWVIGGGYLVYIGYTLVKGFIDKQEGSNIGFCLSGVLFILIGGYLCFIAIREYMRIEKEKKEAEEEARARGEEPVEASTPAGGLFGSLLKAKPQEAPKKTSLAEKARLVSDLEEETQEPAAEISETDETKDEKEESE